MGEVIYVDFRRQHQWERGDRVEHDTFGTGVVVDTRTYATWMTVTVLFDDGSERHLDPARAPMRLAPGPTQAALW